MMKFCLRLDVHWSAAACPAAAAIPAMLMVTETVGLALSASEPLCFWETWSPCPPSLPDARALFASAASGKSDPGPAPCHGHVCACLPGREACFTAQETSWKGCESLCNAASASFTHAQHAAAHLCCALASRAFGCCLAPLPAARWAQAHGSRCQACGQLLCPQQHQQQLHLWGTAAGAVRGFHQI